MHYLPIICSFLVFSFVFPQAQLDPLDSISENQKIFFDQSNKIVSGMKTKKSRNFQIDKFVLPVSLITMGAIETLIGYDLSLRKVFKETFQSKPCFRLDDYIQYAPLVTAIASTFLLDNHQGKHQQKIIRLGGSIFISSFLTNVLKLSLNVERPDKDDNRSFPSGHTSTAFATAEYLFQEYKDTNSLIAYSGYVFAATTGFLRIYNNRHWVGDVLAGAGIGMLSARMSFFLFDQVFSSEKMLSRKLRTKKNVAIQPVVNQDSLEVYLSYEF